MILGKTRGNDVTVYGVAVWKPRECEKTSPTCGTTSSRPSQI